MMVSGSIVRQVPRFLLGGLGFDDMAGVREAWKVFQELAAMELTRERMRVELRAPLRQAAAYAPYALCRSRGDLETFLRHAGASRSRETHRPCGGIGITRLGLAVTSTTPSRAVAAPSLSPRAITLAEACAVLGFIETARRFPAFAAPQIKV
jgi:hypothetical protein